MDGIVAAVTAPKAAGSRTGSLLSLLEDDPQWNGGDYYEHGPPKDTLIRIRREMLKKYGIEEWLQKKNTRPPTKAGGDTPYGLRLGRRI